MKQGARARLEGFFMKFLAAEAMRRILIWGLVSVSLLAVVTTISIAFELQRQPYVAALILDLSLLPTFILWPIDPIRLIFPLRDLDREGQVEAWTEAPDGPASTLLEQGAASILAGPYRSESSGKLLLRGLKPYALAALLALVFLEGLSIILFKEVVIIYHGPRVKGGSGLRIEESNDLGTGPPDRMGLMPSDRARTAADVERRRAEAVDATGSLSQRRNALRAGEKEPAQRSAYSEEGQAERSPGQDRSEGGAGAPPAPISEGAPRPAESGTPGNAPAAAGRGATGFEGNGRSGVASPLIDYRTRLFQMLGELGGGNLRASGELGRAELREFERRYFSSFTLESGIAPREESYAAMLRKRWAGLRDVNK